MRGLLLLAILSVPALAGCLSGKEAGDDVTVPDGLSPVTDVRGRAALPFDTAGGWSRPLVEGTLGILDVQSVFVDVALPPEELGAAADPVDPPRVHMGLWLPDVPEGTKVPVIADIGPYYDDGDVAATERGSGRLGEFLISNYVPHGYAVAQVSVFGSGESGHCMDLMGRSEQLGIDAAVTWLGEQGWSNGNVGLIGRSYDGSTPWEAATFGNPHLKTIVPISGLIGMYELMWRNGSAEFRAPIMHNVVYGAFGIDSAEISALPPGVAPRDPDAADRQTLCKDYLAGPAQGAGAYATGDRFAEDVNDYWAERYFLDRAIADYDGSVYFIHGLQDWNVDPHMAFPAYERLQAAGLEVKGLFGQWDHAYPDRVADHEDLPSGRGREAFPLTVRHDWAQDLLEWFEHYLKGTGAKPALHVEVQDNTGAWRLEATYPPRDAVPVEVGLGAGDLVATLSADDGRPVIGGPSALGAGATLTATFTLPPLSKDDTRIVGLPQLHATVTPTGAGGQLFAELRDAETGLRLGHAIMDLRFHDGGDRMVPVVPGQPIVAKMEFEPLDVVLPGGHGLEVFVAPTGEDYLPSAASGPVLLDPAASVLRLPTVERGADAFFTPPQ